MSQPYGFSAKFSLSLDAAVAAVSDALKQEGFGVLTTIDVQATLEAKLGVNYRPYVILGACNPNLAYQGLLVEPELGLLLPCNVIVYDSGDGNTIVSIVNPLEMLAVVDNPQLKQIAVEAYERLHRVLAHLTDLIVTA